MSVVVPAPLNLGIFADVVPGRFEGSNGPRWIAGGRLPEGKDIPLRLRLAELLPVPFGIVAHAFGQGGIERNGSSFACFGFALDNGEIPLCEIHLRPCQVFQLRISDSSIEGQHDCRKDVRRTRLLRFGQHPFLFLDRVGFGNRPTGLEFEHLALAKSYPQEVPWISHHAKQESDLLVDTFWGRAFLETVILVKRDCSFIAVDEHAAAEDAADMIHSIFSENCGLRMPQFIGGQILVSQVSDRSNSRAAIVCEVVESFFEFTLPLLLCSLRDRLGSALARLPDSPACKDKLVPPIVATTKDCHIRILNQLFVCVRLCGDHSQEEFFRFRLLPRSVVPASTDLNRTLHSGPMHLVCETLGLDSLASSDAVSRG